MFKIRHAPGPNFPGSVFPGLIINIITLELINNEESKLIISYKNSI